MADEEEKEKETVEAEVLTKEAIEADEAEYQKVLEAAKPRVKEAVERLRVSRPPLRANGLFVHPSDWTDQEIAYIIDSLKANVPIHVIAKMVRCERHVLSRLINNNPELRRLKEEQRENMLGNAIFQADRLVQQGNAAMIMYVIDKLGGAEWSGMKGGEGGDGDSRIVMGVIPDDEVQKAEELVKDAQEKNGGSVITDPRAMAMMQETVKEEVEKAVAAAKPEAIDAENVEVSPPPYGADGGVVQNATQGAYDQYGNMGGYQQQDADPWSSGGDSMFFQ